jgi:hypothetical protein
LDRRLGGPRAGLVTVEQKKSLVSAGNGNSIVYCIIVHHFQVLAINGIEVKVRPITVAARSEA